MLNVGLVTHAQLLKSANICNLDLPSPGSQAMLMWGWLPMLNVGLVTQAQSGAGYPNSMWGWLPKLNVGLFTHAQC